MSNAIARRRRGYEHELEIREHRLIADEPERRGGTDSGPTPTELLAASLAGCTAITIEMYADRKEWDLGRVEVEVDFTESEKEMPAGFDVEIRIPAKLNEDQHERLLRIAGKCPVHKALTAQDVEVKDHLQQVEV